MRRCARQSKAQSISRRCAAGGCPRPCDPCAARRSLQPRHRRPDAQSRARPPGRCHCLRQSPPRPCRTARLNSCAATMQRAAPELPYLECGMARAALVAIGLVILAAACGSTGFALTGATVDGTYTCAVGSANTQYDLHTKISADNSTSKSVDVQSIDAVLVVSAVHGQW